MKLSQKNTNLLLTAIICLVGLSLLGSYFIPKPNQPFVTSTSNPVVIPLKKNTGTILSVQATKNSGCDAERQFNEAAFLALLTRQYNIVQNIV